MTTAEARSIWSISAAGLSVLIRFSVFEGGQILAQFRWQASDGRQLLMLWILAIFSNQNLIFTSNRVIIFVITRVESSYLNNLLVSFWDHSAMRRSSAVRLRCAPCWIKLIKTLLILCTEKANTSKILNKDFFKEIVYLEMEIVIYLFHVFHGSPNSLFLWNSRSGWPCLSCSKKHKVL